MATLTERVERQELSIMPFIATTYQRVREYWRWRKYDGGSWSISKKLGAMELKTQPQAESVLFGSPICRK